MTEVSRALLEDIIDEWGSEGGWVSPEKIERLSAALSSEPGEGEQSLEEWAEKAARLITEERYAVPHRSWGNESWDADRSGIAFERAIDEYTRLRATPTTEGEEPEGRAEILQARVDEARAERDGAPSVCVRCDDPIRERLNLYRCAECGMPFHLPCIRAHFRDHAAPEPEREDFYEKVRRSPREATEEVMKERAEPERGGEGERVKQELRHHLSGELKAPESWWRDRVSRLLARREYGDREWVLDVVDAMVSDLEKFPQHVTRERQLHQLGGIRDRLHRLRHPPEAEGLEELRKVWPILDEWREHVVKAKRAEGMTWRAADEQTPEIASILRSVLRRLLQSQGGGDDG